MDRLKQEKSIVKSSIGENLLDSFSKQIMNLRNLMKWMMHRK